MYKIQEAEMLANNIYRMVVEAPRVAQHCLPGQFVIVKADEEGERILLTICDSIEKQELSPSYSCRSENLPKK